MAYLSKGLVFAAGAGLALSLTKSAGRTPPAPVQTESRDEFGKDLLDLTLILDRLDAQDADITALRSSFEAERARTATWERMLAEQTISIGTLKQRAEEAEANMQQLITTVEALYERQLQQSVGGQVPDPIASQGRFQAHLDDAMDRKGLDPRVPLVRTS